MPDWLIGICLLLIFLIVTTLVYKTTVTLYNNKIKEMDALKQKCIQEVVQKEACYEGIKKVMYSMMLSYEKQCQIKGYSESEERETFQSLFDVFEKMGGNFNSKEIRERFYAIPTYEQARRDNPERIYIQLAREGNWVYDNDIPDKCLPNNVANERVIKMQHREQE